MSRLFSTCFGGWEDQSPQRRRRRRHHDSESESSYDSEEESESEEEDDADRFNRAERGEARLGSYRKEEDIRLEEVLSVDDELHRMEKYRGNISVVDDRPPPAAPPVVSRFVEHVLRESHRGYLERRARDSPPSMDVLPQVSLLHEANKLLPESSPAFFQAALKERSGERMSSGGSISSSGSSAGESGRSSSSSGIGDSFTSGNDTGGSGAAGDKNKGNAVKAGEVSRGKVKAKSKWSRAMLQDAVVEEDELANGLGHMSHFGKRGADRSSISTVEGVHFPIAPKEWGAARVLNSDPSARTASKIVKAFNRSRIGHQSNVIKVEDTIKTKGTVLNSTMHLNSIPTLGSQHSFFSDLPKNSSHTRQGIVRF